MIEAPADPDSSGRRVTLPRIWPDDLAGEVVLIRPFSRPPIDDERETACLEAVAVLGLRSAELDGKSVLPTDLAAGTVRLGPGSGPRHVLRLAVDVGAARTQSQPWGEVSIIVRPRATPDQGPDRLSADDAAVR